MAHFLQNATRAYGPETQEIRTEVSRLVVSAVHERWPGESSGPRQAAPDAGHEALVALQRRIILLAPNDAAQSWFQSQALQITNSMVSLRRLMLN